MNSNTPEIEVTRYKDSRFWAVWLDQELLAVVCYKKGALAIKRILLDLFNQTIHSGKKKKRGP